MIIEITRLIGRTLKGYPLTGIDRVCVEYLSHFRDQAKTSFLFGSLFIVNHSLSKKIVNSLCRQNSIDLVKNLSLCPFHLCNAQRGELYVNLTHSGGVELENFKSKFGKRELFKVFMLHDIIPIDHPEFARDGEKQRHQVRLRNMIEIGDLILTNSNYTKQRLIDYVKETLKRDISEKVEVNYLGFSTSLERANFADLHETLKKYGIKHKYCVVLSTIEPRKNHIILFYAWKELHRVLGNQTPMLVLIGRRGWKVDFLINLIRGSNLSHLIIEINNCNDSELKTLLANSQALLMPTVDEGFGLPVLEAIKLNCLTVCSDIPVFRELFGDIPYYCNWSNAKEWTEIVLEILSNRDRMLSGQTLRVSRESERLNRYTWDAHFDRFRLILNRHGFSESAIEEQDGEFKFATKW